jgi:Zn finger protein HypA/HybF involved in hydrogenase expression
MTDYSEYLINAQKLLRGIGENANEENYKKAFELAYHLGQLSDMLKESLLLKIKKS